MQLDTSYHCSGSVFCHFISTMYYYVRYYYPSCLSSKCNYYKNWKELALLLGHNQSLLLCLVIS